MSRHNTSESLAVEVSSGMSQEAIDRQFIRKTLQRPSDFVFGAIAKAIFNYAQKFVPAAKKRTVSLEVDETSFISDSKVPDSEHKEFFEQKEFKLLEEHGLKEKSFAGLIAWKQKHPKLNQNLFESVLRQMAVRKIFIDQKELYDGSYIRRLCYCYLNDFPHDKEYHNHNGSYHLLEHAFVRKEFKQLDDYPDVNEKFLKLKTQVNLFKHVVQNLSASEFKKRLENICVRCIEEINAIPGLDLGTKDLIVKTLLSLSQRIISILRNIDDISEIQKSEQEINKLVDNALNDIKIISHLWSWWNKEGRGQYAQALEKSPTCALDLQQWCLEDLAYLNLEDLGLVPYGSRRGTDQYTLKSSTGWGVLKANNEPFIFTHAELDLLVKADIVKAQFTDYKVLNGKIIREYPQGVVFAIPPERIKIRLIENPPKDIESNTLAKVIDTINQSHQIPKQKVYLRVDGIKYHFAGLGHPEQLQEEIPAIVREVSNVFENVASNYLRPYTQLDFDERLEQESRQIIHFSKTHKRKSFDEFSKFARNYNQPTLGEVFAFCLCSHSQGRWQKHSLKELFRQQINNWFISNNKERDISGIDDSNHIKELLKEYIFNQLGLHKHLRNNYVDLTKYLDHIIEKAFSFANYNRLKYGKKGQADSMAKARDLIDSLFTLEVPIFIQDDRLAHFTLKECITTLGTTHDADSQILDGLSVEYSKGKVFNELLNTMGIVQTMRQDIRYQELCEQVRQDLDAVPLVFDEKPNYDKVKEKWIGLRIDGNDLSQCIREGMTGVGILANLRKTSNSPMPQSPLTDELGDSPQGAELVHSRSTSLIDRNRDQISKEKSDEKGDGRSYSTKKSIVRIGAVKSRPLTLKKGSTREDHSRFLTLNMKGKYQDISTQGEVKESAIGKQKIPHSKFFDTVWKYRTARIETRTHVEGARSGEELDPSRIRSSASAG